MNVIANAFILAFVNGALSPFNFAQESARFSSSLPGENQLKTHRKQALICSGKNTQSGNTAKCIINMRSMKRKTNEGSSTTSDSASTVNTASTYDCLKLFYEKVSDDPGGKSDLFV